MAEETQTPEQVNRDDVQVLRYVLEHVRGSEPVSVFRQADFVPETVENE